MTHLSNDPSFLQLVHLLDDERLLLRHLALCLLLDRTSIGTHRQMVLKHFPRDAGLVGRLPGEHILITPEESDECTFLLRGRPALIVKVGPEPLPSTDTFFISARS